MPMRLILMLVFGLVSLGCSRSGTSEPGGDAKQRAEDTAGSAIEVTVEAAAKDFTVDARAARAKYAGKVVILEGRIADLGRPIDRDLHAVLVGLTDPPGRQQGTPMNCSFRPGDEAKMLALSWDHPVKVRGRCLEDAWLTNLRLVNCTLESAGADPSIRLTPAALIADIRRLTGGAALAKYSGKPVTLIGSVVQEKLGANDLFLATEGVGAKGFTIHASRTLLRRADDERFDALKPGDRITIHCRFGSIGFNRIDLDDCRIVPTGE